jgi:tryptophanyl-tRNA synthetase
MLILIVFIHSINSKIKRAVTDSTSGITFDPQSRPAVSNLVSILASATHRDPHEVRTLPRVLCSCFASNDAAGKALCSSEQVARSLERASHADLKRQTAEAVVAVVQPIREEIARLLDDKTYVVSCVCAYHVIILLASPATIYISTLHLRHIQNVLSEVRNQRECVCHCVGMIAL